MNYIFDADYRLSGIFIDELSARRYIDKMQHKLVTFNDKQITKDLDKETLTKIYDANGQMLIRSFKNRNEAAWWVMTLLHSKTGTIAKKEIPKKGPNRKKETPETGPAHKKEAPKNDNLSRK